MEMAGTVMAQQAMGTSSEISSLLRPEGAENGSAAIPAVVRRAEAIVSHSDIGGLALGAVRGGRRAGLQLSTFAARLLARTKKAPPEGGF
jgi:hypothetical protein